MIDDPADINGRAFCTVNNRDRKSTRLNSSHTVISYAVFCLKKKKKNKLLITSPKAMAKVIVEDVMATNKMTMNSEAMSGTPKTSNASSHEIIYISPNE